MRFEITWLFGAQADMVEAYSRLGDVFYRRVDTALGHLILFPEMARIYAGCFRRLVLTATPFGLFYCIEPNRRLGVE